MVLVEIYAKSQKQDSQEDVSKMLIQTELSRIPNLGLKITLSQELDLSNRVKEIVYNPFFSQEEEAVVQVFVVVNPYPFKTLGDALIPLGWVSSLQSEAISNTPEFGSILEGAILAIGKLYKKAASGEPLDDPVARIVTMNKHGNKVVIVARPLKCGVLLVSPQAINISSDKGISMLADKLISSDVKSLNSIRTYMRGAAGAELDGVAYYGLEWTMRLYIGVC